DHWISISEAGALTIRSKRYTCSVDSGGEALDKAAIPELFAAAGAVRLGGRPAVAASEAEPGTPSVRLMLAQARTAAAPPPAPPAAASPAGASAPGASVSAPQAMAPARPGETAAPPPQDLQAAVAVELDGRLRALLRDRYLRLLEARCGPVPPGLRPD
ncbi:MAG: hypothetical protein ACRD6R_12310, partial [Candidatus Polarisedimenticolia bacterium]